ncbi:Oidioi.mRNA.OKI2018_I69.chr1.g2775.t1.cds [Oikopleura dioica]|uniref:Oidioi.mRNA.OKI2018_I69.chr1.g2775.t1.cds n=1 Tax=Oikopleura dioica TaxID=34765 RepID=A0ABN7SWD2_OIKDI|nr:Oidioi.mRNA.OKI2018_I69.chr1.g2775.t1.cds [Oikopleura dioica]
MVQGSFMIPGRKGGVYCFPLSRLVSRIRGVETELIDNSRHYSNFLQPQLPIASTEKNINKRSFVISFGSLRSSHRYCKLLMMAAGYQHYIFKSSTRICSIFNEDSNV